jgi:spermidine/putrescine transport system substrate-binding protein
MQRSKLGMGLVAAGSAVLIAFAVSRFVFSGPTSARDVPVLFQWQDYVEAPFLKGYEAAFKETPQTAIYADEDEALAKMRAGYKPDVMGPCAYEFPRWQEAGLLQPIDTGKLQNWSKIAPALRALPDIDAGNGRVWFVPHYWGNTSITFRTDLAPEYVGRESWEILFDPKYKGRVAVLEGVDDTVPFIAHMIGVDAYNMSEEDWYKVQAKLRALVDQARFVSSDNTSLAQGLASGEIVAAMSWRVVYATLRRQGVPVAYMNPPGGIFTYVCGLVVNKDAKNYDKALALIDSSLSDEAAHYTFAEIGDGPANVEGLGREPDELFTQLGIDRDVDTFLRNGIFQRRLKNKDELINAWTEIRAGR